VIWAGTTERSSLQHYCIPTLRTLAGGRQRIRRQGGFEFAPTAQSPANKRAVLRRATENPRTSRHGLKRGRARSRPGIRRRPSASGWPSLAQFSRFVSTLASTREVGVSENGLLAPQAGYEHTALELTEPCLARRRSRRKRTSYLARSASSLVVTLGL
jgi:hypothetical protein